MNSDRDKHELTLIELDQTATTLSDYKELIGAYLNTNRVELNCDDPNRMDLARLVKENETLRDFILILNEDLKKSDHMLSQAKREIVSALL